MSRDAITLSKSLSGDLKYGDIEALTPVFVRAKLRYKRWGFETRATRAQSSGSWLFACNGFGPINGHAPNKALRRSLSFFPIVVDMLE